MGRSSGGGVGEDTVVVSGIWRTARKFVYKRMLHADDTPHRIALGVGIATFVLDSGLIAQEQITFGEYTITWLMEAVMMGLVVLAGAGWSTVRQVILAMAARARGSCNSRMIREAASSSGIVRAGDIFSSRTM